MSGERPEAVQAHELRTEFETSSLLGKWYSWDSPVGLGLFFVFSALAVSVLIAVIHYAFH